MLRSEALTRAVADERSGRLDNLDAAGDCLLVTLGGLADRGAYAAFEFVRSTQHLDVPTMYLRDRRQCWYLRGVDGLGDDLPSAADRLRAVKDELGVSRLVLLGQSMGGFGAIALGCLAGADVAVAISPQTTVRRRDRARMADTRYARELHRTHELVKGLPVERHLRPLVARTPGTAMMIHVDPDERRDVRHADRLAALPNVSVTTWPWGGHLLSRELVARGELATLLAGVVSGATGI